MEHIRYFVLPTLLIMPVFSRQKISFFADFTHKIVIMAICIPVFSMKHAQSSNVQINGKARKM